MGKYCIRWDIGSEEVFEHHALRVRVDQTHRGRRESCKVQDDGNKSWMIQMILICIIMMGDTMLHMHDARQWAH
jgi:hypothetical protein